MRTGLLLLAVVGSTPLRAQDLCLPEALGVPGLQGAPRWWSNPNMMTRLDDPRWRGAVSQDFYGEVEFRALHRPDSMFLSWQARIDQEWDQANVSNNPPPGDQLVVGIKQQSGPSLIIHFGLASTASNQEANGLGVGFRAYTWDGTTLLDAPAAVPWIQASVRAWTSADTPNKRWAFQMAVPISSAGLDNGINIASPFQMFYAFLVKMPTGFPEYRWPATLPLVRMTSGVVRYPDPALPWGSITWGTSTNCAGDVALDMAQIGTENTPSSEIRVTAPNAFFARPRNLRPTGGNPLTSGSIQARFFLAEWGTQVGNLTSTSWRELTLTAIPTNAGDIGAGSAATAANDIAFTWTLSPAERCSYTPSDPSCTDKRFEHQCVLVQLAHLPPPAPAPATTPLVFRNQSVYRNMDFVPASTFKRTAQVSVVGLTPIADGRQDRDVYLYVETNNLPSVIPAGVQQQDPIIVAGRDTLIVALRDTTLQLPWGVIRLAKGDSALVPTRHTLFRRGRDGVDRFAAVQRAVQAGQLTSPEVDSLLPTYRVHAYHTTGDSLGQEPILEPQTSFGYWVGHEGEVAGWQHRLEGERLVQLAPNYYRISVPNNGTTTVTTIIRALEPRLYALSLHAGASLPHGAFNATHDVGFGITADAEYWWHRRLAVLALAGYHRFGGSGTNPDLDLFHGSVALEARLIAGRPSVLADAGGGVYHLSPGSTDAGVHAGAGIEWDLSATVSLSLSGRVHTVFTTGSNTTFSSWQAGARLRF